MFAHIGYIHTETAFTLVHKQSSSLEDSLDLLVLIIKIVEGDERNIKVTTPMDLKIAEMLLEEMQ